MRIRLMSLIVFIAVLLFPSALMAQNYTVVTNVSVLNMRAEPVSGSVVKKLKNGARLTVVSRTDTTDINDVWLKVRADDGTTGWVKAKGKTTDFLKYAKSDFSAMPADSMMLDEATTPMDSAPEMEADAPEMGTGMEQGMEDPGMLEPPPMEDNMMPEAMDTEAEPMPEPEQDIQAEPSMDEDLPSIDDDIPEIEILDADIDDI